MELFRALATLAEPPTPETANVARLLGLKEPPASDAYTDLFVIHQVPYASAYLSADGMIGGEPRDRVAGFWRALGLEPPAEPDHLATLLGAYAALAEQDGLACDNALRQALAHARRAFLWEHLLSWMPFYLQAVERHAAAPYPDWARLLREALLEEGREQGALELLPLHLRDVPPIPDPRDADAAQFLAAIVAPARSGIILTRADLARAAHALDAGARAGDRTQVLRSLLEQDAGGALAWIADEARAWQDRHACLAPALGPIAAFWTERAGATAALAAALRDDAVAFRN